MSKFVVGKYYKCTLKRRGRFWNKEGMMDDVLDGEPRKCLYSANYGNPSLNSFHVVFDNMTHQISRTGWVWERRHFKEVKLEEN